MHEQFYQCSEEKILLYVRLKHGKYCVLFGLTHSPSTLSHGVIDCYEQCSAKYEKKLDIKKKRKKYKLLFVDL